MLSRSSKSITFWHQWNQSLIASAVTLLCLLAIGGIQVPRLNKITEREKNVSVEMQREVESERLRLNLIEKTPTFGFNNLISDWIFLNFLQYFGDDIARPQTGYALSPEYFEIIVDRDPRFFEPYIALSTSVSLYAGLPDKSVALMEKGLKSMSPKIPPKSYFVWRYKGIDELLFLGNLKAAQQSFKKAAQWAVGYSDPESRQIAFNSERTSQFLASNPNISCAREGAWALVLVNAINSNDERSRDVAIDRIQKQGGKVFISPQGAIRVQLPKCKRK